MAPSTVARIVVLAVAVIVFAAVAPAAVADDDFPNGATANNSSAVSISVEPDIPVTSEQVTLRALNTSAINDTDVFVSWDVDDDGIGDAVGSTVTTTFAEVGEHRVRAYVTDYTNETVAATTVTVTEGVAPVTDRQPTDPNGDGLFEDVDGDGAVTLTDALVYYNNRNSPAITDQPDAFDFDGDGRAGTLFDALALYNSR